MRSLFLTILLFFACAGGKAATDSITHTVSAIIFPLAAGQVNGTGSYTKGSFVTLEALPANGFTFGYWSFNGMITSMNATFPLVVDTDLVIQATFLQQPDSFWVTAAAFPANAGTITGTGFYKGGDTAFLTAYTNPGYIFENWLVNGIVVDTDSSYAFPVTANVQVSANYQQLPVQVTISTEVFPSADAGATTGDGIYNQGDTVHVTASAKAGYVFANWQVLGIITATDTAYSFIATADIHLQANFLPSQVIYTITTDVLPALAGTVQGGGLVAQDSTVTLQAIAGNGYAFEYWEEDNTELSRLNPYTFTATANRAITARFKLLTSVTDKPAEMLTLTPNFGSGPFTLRTDKTYYLQAFNNTGALVLKKTINEGNSLIEINYPGLYILQFTNEEGVTITRKLVVQ